MRLRCWLSCCVLMVLPSAAGAFSYDEGVNGDLSGDRLDPIMLGESVRHVGTTIAGDEENTLHIVLQPDTQLSQRVLNCVMSTDDPGFIGVQAGSIFTVPPSTAQERALLGTRSSATGDKPARLESDGLDDEP